MAANTEIEIIGVGYGDQANDCAIHPDAQENDWVVAFFAGDTVGSWATPSGWTLINLSTTTNPDHMCIKKKMTATPDTSVDSGSNAWGISVVYRGVDATTSEDAAVIVATGTTLLPNPGSITTVTDNALVLAIGMLDDDNVRDQVTAPTGYTSLFTHSGFTNVATLMIAHKIVASAAAEDPAAFTGTGTDSWVALTVALRPIVPTVPIINPTGTTAEFEDTDTGLFVKGDIFEAVQGTGKLELSDNAVYASGTKVEQTVTSWADESLTFTADLGALGPGTRYLWVTNDSADINVVGFPVTVHRETAFQLSASANIAASGENTTEQMTPPATKTTVTNFGGGRIQDDENPGDTVDLDTDDWREDEWSIEAIDGVAADTEVYNFRVIMNGVPLDTYTLTPAWTIAIASGAITGTIGTTAPGFAIAATGVEQIIGLADPIAPFVAVDMTGLLDVPGIIGVTAPFVAVGMTGLLNIPGIIGITAPFIDMTATGVTLMNVTGVADPVAPFVQIGMTGSLSMTGIATMVAPGIQMDAAGILGIDGSIGMVAPSFLIDMTGTEEIIGLADPVAPFISINMIGELQVVTGTAGMTAPYVLMSASGFTPNPFVFEPIDVPIIENDGITWADPDDEVTIALEAGSLFSVALDN